MISFVNQEFHKNIVITKELEHAIKFLKSVKFPGHDNLSCKHFKYALY